MHVCHAGQQAGTDQAAEVEYGCPSLTVWIIANAVGGQPWHCRPPVRHARVSLVVQTAELNLHLWNMNCLSVGTDGHAIVSGLTWVWPPAGLRCNWLQLEQGKRACQSLKGQDNTAGCTR